MVGFGFEGQRANRTPWVCLAVALILIALALYNTYATRRKARALEEVLTYWQQRPYLSLTSALEDLFTPSLRSAMQMAAEAAELPSPEQVAAEQGHLAQLAAAYADARDSSPLERWSLVPARGIAQPGWLSHLFFHGGWTHLLGNLFFLMLMGPFCEQAWGRRIFVWVLLLGGALAGLAQAFTHAASTSSIYGASGSIAVCVGAFAVWSWRRRIVLYVRNRAIGRVWAWLWVVPWLLLDVLAAFLPGAHGAVTAHITGFLLGAVLVLLSLRAARVGAPSPR